MDAKVALGALAIGLSLPAGTCGGDVRQGERTRVVELPQPSFRSETSLEETLRERRSVRSFAREPLSLVEVSQLLWAAQGTTAAEGKRTAPSAGALYPLELHVVVGAVAGLEPGIYHYRPERHDLVERGSGDVREELAIAALGQECIGEGAVVLVLAAVYERTTTKYGTRGERYVHMEVGHAAQNVYLQAASLGLGTVVVGAFDEAGVGKLLGFPARERPLVLMPVGRRR